MAKQPRHRSERDVAENRRQVEFVARRAYRSPTRSCTRQNVIQAFNVSSARATQILAEALAGCSQLVRQARAVVAPPWGVAPHWAGEEDLLESLEGARFGFADTGLTDEELPINVVVWRKKLPSAPGALDAVVRAIGSSMPVLIQYTSLNRGDLGKWRRILPLCLECVDGQWRVCAQDLDKSDAPLRTFGLTRIVDFRDDVDPVPRSLIRHNPRDSMARLRVQIDRRMTPSQFRAIEVEFGVRNGIVLVPSRGIHEFKRHFVQGALPSEDAIWPPFESAELP